MPVQRLAENLHVVGVVNPNLRIFDIIMKTEFGTSYNAYLIKDEKSALVETVHEQFWDAYERNIAALVDPARIDYIIFNHTEPDHSGSLVHLLKINPELTVVGTGPALKYLQKVTNLPFKTLVVKDGDRLELGKRTLRFIVAPNLHWPDSMFTVIEEEGIAFTCDFLGAHYCEPYILDTRIAYPEKYDAAFKYYYDAIFGPFKKFVLAGLEKLPADLKLVCPSHGPVLTEGRIALARSLYREWSTPPAKEGKSAFIAYVSAYGYTRTLAEESARVLVDEGYRVECCDLVERQPDMEKVHNADLLLIGSPTINKDALKPVWDFISSFDAINIANKKCGLIGSYGWSGEALPALKSRLATLKLKVGDGFKVQFAPNSDELEQLRSYVRELAQA